MVGLLERDGGRRTSIIFLVRHAERAEAGGGAQKNPGLSAAGRRRAQMLAETLRDANITAIYTSEFRRTQERAKPLAEKLGIRPIMVTARDTKQLLADLTRSNGNVLVIGHSNTLPEIMPALGIKEPPTLGERDYDNLFLLRRDPTPRLIRLHFSLGRQNSIPAVS